VKAFIRIFSTAVTLFAVAFFVRRSFDAMLWLDELYTVSLMSAASLTDLWAAIVLGLDGNPPVYMTTAWLLVHAVPQSVSWTEALTWLNVAFTVASLVFLYRVSRRLVSAPASWMASFLFAVVNNGPIYLALELRTYALYFFTITASILWQLRVMENRRRADVLLLATLYCLLAQAHTFGIIYVLCISLSAYVSITHNGNRPTRLCLFPMVPAILVFACWLPFLLIQIEVAEPYGWIPRPGILELVKSAFPSAVSALIGLGEIACLAGFLPWYFRIVREHSQMPLLRPLDVERSAQSFRFVCVLLVSISLFAMFAWAVSRAFFPLFVARYFTPNLIISFALNAAVCEFLVEFFQTEIVRPIPPALVQMLALIPPTLLAVVFLYKIPVAPQIPCLDETGAFFEEPFVRHGIPIVVESPHVWFPRTYYSRYRSLYLFPLDWAVVLKFPTRAANNASDFNIMERFKLFARVSTILPTEEIVQKYPEFLVVNESGRAWYHNLTNVRLVSAIKLAETPADPEGRSCVLWHVQKVENRP
jgi:hypothetical protein